MVKRTINKDIINSINKFIEEIKKQYNVTAIILFGSYAKGTENENSDIDIAVISDDFDDIYDCMAILMGMTWDIDARIEPHPIKTEDYKRQSRAATLLSARKPPCSDSDIDLSGTAEEKFFPSSVHFFLECFQKIFISLFKQMFESALWS